MIVAPFTYNASASRVLFGPGRLAELGAELDRLAIRRAMLLSTPRQAVRAETVVRRLGDQAGGLYARATMHTPTDVTADALAQLKSAGCDGLVPLGGGSTIGLGKALALRTDLPQVAIPTTYAGSEMTPILGETEGGRKTTQRSPKVLPETVIYDVELTLSLPPGLSATSGLNAHAHAVEALYSRDANPIISVMAEEGIAALERSLLQIVRDPANRQARMDAQYGAWLCGACLGAVGMALHHKICHVLGGTFDLRHAETHTVMLPHVAAYNAEAAPDAMRRIERALGVERAAAGLFALNRSLGAPAALRDLGMPKPGIEQAVDLIMQAQFWNPRQVDRVALRAMLTRAWAGEPPKLG
ncbi:MAG: maleylacetate reductase [Acetobacteraceae bacterium]|nr:maleylacetate reductase [Acetobacteraceae bacterium]